MYTNMGNKTTKRTLKTSSLEDVKGQDPKLFPKTDKNKKSESLKEETVSNSDDFTELSEVSNRKNYEKFDGDSIDDDIHILSGLPGEQSPKMMETDTCSNKLERDENVPDDSLIDNAVHGNETSITKGEDKWIKDKSIFFSNTARWHKDMSNDKRLAMIPTCRMSNMDRSKHNSVMEPSHGSNDNVNIRVADENETFKENIEGGTKCNLGSPVVSSNQRYDAPSHFKKIITPEEVDNRLICSNDDGQTGTTNNLYSNVIFLPGKSKGASPKRYVPKRPCGISNKSTSEESDSEKEINKNNVDKKELCEVETKLEVTEPVNSTVNETIEKHNNSCEHGTEFFGEMDQTNVLTFKEDHFGLYTGSEASGFSPVGPNTSTAKHQSVHENIETEQKVIADDTKRFQDEDKLNVELQPNKADDFKGIPDRKSNLPSIESVETCVICNKLIDECLCLFPKPVYSPVAILSCLEHCKPTVRYYAYLKCGAKKVAWSSLKSSQAKFAMCLKSVQTHLPDDNRLKFEFNFPGKQNVECEDFKLNNNISRQLGARSMDSGSIRTRSNSFDSTRNVMINDFDELSDDEIKLETENHGDKECSLIYKNSHEPDDLSRQTWVNYFDTCDLDDSGSINDETESGESMCTSTHDSDGTDVESDTLKDIRQSDDDRDKIETYQGINNTFMDMNVGASSLKRCITKPEHDNRLKEMTYNDDKLKIETHQHSNKTIFVQNVDMNGVEMTKPRSELGAISLEPLSDSFAQLPDLDLCLPPEQFRQQWHNHREKLEKLYSERLGSEVFLRQRVHGLVGNPHRQFFSDFASSIPNIANQSIHNSYLRNPNYSSRPIPSTDKHEESTLLSPNSSMSRSPTDIAMSPYDSRSSTPEKSLLLESSMSDLPFPLTNLGSKLTGNDDGAMRDSDDDGDVSSDDDDYIDNILEAVFDQEKEKYKQLCRTLRSCRCTVLCVDTSDSMKGKPWQQTKEFISKFIAGLINTREEHGVQECIALVTYGQETKIVCHLADNYETIVTALDTISPNGCSPLKAGFVFSIACLFLASEYTSLKLRLHDIVMCHRIIVFTDGWPTPVRRLSDNDDISSKWLTQVFKELNFFKDMKVFSVNWIPVGDHVNTSFFETVCSITANSSASKLSDVDEISRNTFLHYVCAQVCYHMFKIPNGDALDVNMFKSLITQTYPGVTTTEMSVLEKLASDAFKQKHVESSGDDSSSDEDDNVKDFYEPHDMENLPRIGDRVTVGPDLSETILVLERGTVTGHSRRVRGKVSVQWDDGPQRLCSYGCYDKWEILPIETEEEYCADDIKLGDKVRRGPDWSYGNDDGGINEIGVVYHITTDDVVFVRWTNGICGNYRYNQDGMFDVLKSDPKDPSGYKNFVDTMNQRNKETVDETET